MNQEEITKRNGKSLNLRVIQLDGSSFYVESEEGKICYKVCCGDGNENACSCGDFARGAKTDPHYTCKHLLAVLNSEADFEQAHILEKSKPKLDERFIMTIEGQDFVKYAGLLDLAHQKKLTSLQTEIVQFPNQENERTAIVKAHARTATGALFTDVGDANPMNCTSKIAKHIIRLASTRAKARALRDLTNIGMTCLEELGDLDDVIGSEEKGTARRDKVRPFPKKIVKGEATVSQPGNGDGDGTRPADPAKGVSMSGATVNREAKEQVKEPSRDEKKATVENQTAVKGAKKSGGNGQNKKTDIPAKMSEAQKRAVYNLSRRRGISVEELEKMSKDTYGVPLENLSASDASSFIRQLQQSA